MADSKAPNKRKKTHRIGSQRLKVEPIEFVILRQSKRDGTYRLLCTLYKIWLNHWRIQLETFTNILLSAGILSIRMITRSTLFHRHLLHWLETATAFRSLCLEIFTCNCIPMAYGNVKNNEMMLDMPNMPPSCLQRPLNASRWSPSASSNRSFSFSNPNRH